MALRDKQLHQVKMRLDRLKRLPNVLDEEMSDIAHDIQVTARAMAPIDYGSLKHAIKIRRSGTVQTGIKGFVKGRSSFFVYVDPNTPAPDHKEGTVGGYAWLIHEHMGYGGTIGAIMPSNKSVSAGSALGEVAGGKFMDRAFEKHKGKIRAKLSRKRDKFISNFK